MPSRPMDRAHNHITIYTEYETSSLYCKEQFSLKIFFGYFTLAVIKFFVCLRSGSFAASLIDTLALFLVNNLN